MSKAAHLRVYRFEPGAPLEGGLAGAVERMQVGPDAQLLDALFVAREPSSGDVVAVDLATGGAGGTFASLLDFRLDDARRRALTERTLAEHPAGVPRRLIEEMAVTLEAGAAIFVVLHTGGAPTALEDTVARCRGRLITDEPVDASALVDLGPRLRTAASPVAD